MRRFVCRIRAAVTYTVDEFAQLWQFVGDHPTSWVDRIDVLHERKVLSDSDAAALLAKCFDADFESEDFLCRFEAIFARLPTRVMAQQLCNTPIVAAEDTRRTPRRVALTCLLGAVSFALCNYQKDTSSNTSQINLSPQEYSLYLECAVQAARDIANVGVAPDLADCVGRIARVFCALESSREYCSPKVRQVSDTFFLRTLKLQEIKKACEHFASTPLLLSQVISWRLQLLARCRHDFISTLALTRAALVKETVQRLVSERGSHFGSTDVVQASVGDVATWLSHVLRSLWRGARAANKLRHSRTLALALPAVASNSKSLSSPGYILSQVTTLLAEFQVAKLASIYYHKFGPVLSELLITLRVIMQLSKSPMLAEEVMRISHRVVTPEHL
ncbi:MAG: hypothetical protein MHM6MM_001530 [Cercozoa sp. M6MM]